MSYLSYIGAVLFVACLVASIGLSVVADIRHMKPDAPVASWLFLRQTLIFDLDEAEKLWTPRGIQLKQWAFGCILGAVAAFFVCVLSTVL